MTVSIFIIIISAERRPLLDIGLPKSSPRRLALRCPHPVASRDIHQIVSPPCGGPTNVSRYPVAIREPFRFPLFRSSLLTKSEHHARF
jgi:hypothetical protein